MITVDHLRSIAGSRSHVPLMLELAQAFNIYAPQYGVTQKDDLADLLAHVCVETGGFKKLSENLNYSASALKKVFGRHRISLADCDKYGRKKGRPADQVAIANIIYGGEWGAKNLGNTRPGDGWKFRGSGPGQITGRANFNRVQNTTGINVCANPELMRDPAKGVETTLALWEEWDMNSYEGGSVASRKKWNGGDHGLEKYQAAYKRAIALPLRVPAPPVPRKAIREVIHDTAAQGRISTTQTASAIGGATGLGTVINELSNHSYTAQSWLQTMQSFDIKTLVIIGLVGILVYVWWRRKRKQTAAKALL